MRLGVIGKASPDMPEYSSGGVMCELEVEIEDIDLSRDLTQEEMDIINERAERVLRLATHLAGQGAPYTQKLVNYVYDRLNSPPQSGTDRS